MVRPARANPDWEQYLYQLQELLTEVLEEIKEDSESAVGSDVSCLNAYDTLNQFLEGVKRELGI